MILRFISLLIFLTTQNASTIKKKRFVPKKYESDVPLEVTSVCSLDQTLLEHATGYEFIQGYTDQSGWNAGVTLSQLAQAQRGHQLFSYNKSYYCPPGNIEALLSMTYQSDPSFAVLHQRQSMRLHDGGIIAGNAEEDSTSVTTASSGANSRSSNSGSSSSSSSSSSSDGRSGSGVGDGVGGGHSGGPGRLFNARRFLSLMRGKTIAFIGDSLARQVGRYALHI